ncbi:HPt (histidine-containing phosphotransfer) domain-containing protein [Halospina denitrificans]|uniref:HPt (Histidine-containing phosphotransfer) domain-containing protein n=1 Tax=Halospina denitrificans TaxID=332522 RepID=A0A4V3EPZ3_9GAMM|nr:Hpt domain-containing protein [Halospina denitrificans]TDT39278.1 HPt (histidine-containing phosphotransfer) domain-containing protein [Halospina denitrificans]
MSDQQHLDHEALTELRDVMEDEFNILINTFLQDADERLRQLSEAARAEDADSFRKVAHSFKGSCINIGAPILAECCFAAEQAGREDNLSQSGQQVAAIEEELATVSEQLRRYVRE